MVNIRNILFIIFIPAICFAQDNSIVINNSSGSSYIVLKNGSSSNPATVYVNQSKGTGIIRSGATSGGIISEGEFNQVKWEIGTASDNTYTIPFINAGSGTSIPYTLSVSAAGTGSGNIKFSTYAVTYSNSPLPSDVTQPFNIPGPDYSLYVADRFWIIDANGYTTKPTPAGMVLTYIDPAEIAAPNTITEANLQAQRFNSTVGDWSGFLAGTADAGTNKVTVSSAIAPADFFRSWVLVDNTNPLPVELLYFNAICDNSKILIAWSTASETNNSFFTIEKSQDGINFLPVKILAGSGNSSSLKNYSFTDTATSGGIYYYRLAQTDLNGKKTIYLPVSANCIEQAANAGVYPNPSEGNVNIVINNSAAEELMASVCDITGREIFSKIFPLEPGTNFITLDAGALAGGVYFVRLVTASGLKFMQRQIIVK